MKYEGEFRGGRVWGLGEILHPLKFLFLTRKIDLIQLLRRARDVC